MSITAVFYLTESVAVMKTLNRANWRLSDVTASGNVSPKKWTTMPPKHLAKEAGAAVFMLNDLFSFISPVPRGHRT